MTLLSCYQYLRKAWNKISNKYIIIIILLGSRSIGVVIYGTDCLSREPSRGSNCLVFITRGASRSGTQVAVSKPFTNFITAPPLFCFMTSRILFECLDLGRNFLTSCMDDFEIEKQRIKFCFGSICRYISIFINTNNSIQHFLVAWKPQHVRVYFKVRVAKAEKLFVEACYETVACRSTA